MEVAVAQLSSSLDKSANRDLAVQTVQAAAADGASLVVLPEAMMADFGEPSVDLTELAEPLYGPFVKALTRAAADTGATVVAGMFEPATGEARVYNTTVVVAPEGHVGAYRKFHLYDALGWRESARIKPGNPTTDETVVFKCADHIVGVMTCYDLRFPEMGRTLVDLGATLLVVPAHFVRGPGKEDTWTVLLRARAIENTVYVAGAGKPGPECIGHSMIVDPLGEVLAELDGEEQGVAKAEVSVDSVKEARSSIPVLESRRFVVRAKGV